MSPTWATLRELLRSTGPDTIGSSAPRGEREGHVEATSARALGLHRVLEPPGVLPQAALRLDPDPRIGPDEVRIAVERLNLDAASFRQLREACGGDGDGVRAAVLGIIGARGKMQNPATGS